jgi:hypothetical protein
MTSLLQWARGPLASGKGGSAIASEQVAFRWTQSCPRTGGALHARRQTSTTQHLDQALAQPRNFLRGQPFEESHLPLAQTTVNANRPAADRADNFRRLHGPAETAAVEMIDPQRTQTAAERRLFDTAALPSLARLY